MTIKHRPKNRDQRPVPARENRSKRKLNANFKRLAQGRLTACALFCSTKGFHAMQASITVRSAEPYNCRHSPLYFKFDARCVLTFRCKYQNGA